MDPEITDLLHNIDTKELEDWDGEIPSTTCSRSGLSQLHDKDSTLTPDSSATSAPSTSGTQRHKTKKNVKRPRFNIELDRTKILDAAVDITKAAIEKSLTNPRFGMKCGYGEEVRLLAKAILDKNVEEPFRKFSREIVSDVLGTAETGQGALSSAASDLIWTAFHKVRTNLEIKGNWETFLSSLGVEGKLIVKSLLHQYVLRTILGDVIIHHSAKDTQRKQSATSSSAHSDHDMQVLRYIAGFVPFSLINKYKRAKSEQAKNYVTLLKQWQLNDEDSTFAPSFLSYTVTWLNLQNRGGLFKVSDDVFRFFFTLEKISKKIMTKSNLKDLNVGINQILQDKIKASPEVHNMWKKITSSSSFQSKNLFDVVIQKWIKLRVNAFVKAYNIVKKQEKQASKKGEKSLRKELSK